MTRQQLHDNRLRIGKQLSDIRTSKGLTQQQVADLAGITRQGVERVEQGRYSVGIDILSKISEALNCRVDIISIK